MRTSTLPLLLACFLGLCPAGLADTLSSISANFNGTAIGGSDYIWFSSVLKPSGLGTKPVTIFVRNSTITFTANGTTYTVPVPDSNVTFSPSAASSTTTFIAAQNLWQTTVPSSGLAGNILLDAAEFPVPQGGLPGGIQHVTWNAYFSTDTAGISLQWKWGAALYTSFSTDYNAVGVKPVDDNTASQYQNSDHAGTPENFKGYVTGGTTGGGGSNYTGGLSGTDSTTVAVNQIPTANPGGPYTGVVGQVLSFNGAGSSDADGDQLTYSWSFGDGATASGVSPTHAYMSSGTFAVTLTVNDGRNDTGTATTTATITLPVPPSPPTITAQILPSPNPAGWNNTPVTVSFTCSSSSSTIASCTPPITLITEGANQTISGTATDAAGNTASTSVSLNIDLTPPALAVTTPTDGMVVSNSILNVAGTATDALSGVADVACNGVDATLTGGSVSCTLTLSVGPNAIQVHATDLAGNTATTTINTTYNLTPPPSALFVTPDHFAMAMSESRQVALVDDLARAIPASSWTVSDPTVAQVAPDGTITPLAAGTATITATYQSLSAAAQLTVYGSQTFPPATVRWTVQPLPGDTLLEVFPGQAAGPDDPDVYFAEQAGSNIVMRALTSDGRQKWAHTILPTLGSGGVRAPVGRPASPSLKTVSMAQAQSRTMRPHRWGKKITVFMNKIKQRQERQKALRASDASGTELQPAKFNSSVRGGRLTLVSEHKKAFLRTVQSGGSSVDVTVLSAAVTDAGNKVVNTFESNSFGGCTSRVDNIIVLDTNGNELWRHSIPCGEMGFALHPDGIVYILQADYNNGTMILFAFDEISGAQKFAITLPYSWGGTLLAFVGLPSVLPDGDLYLPVETAASPDSLDTLQLWKVATDGTYSTYPITTASQCYGPVIEPHEALPDGQGGVLVTWDYFGAINLCNVIQPAVPVAHLSAAGQVLNQQALPLAVLRLPSYFSDNDGDALLGAQHLYVTDGRESAVGLNLTTSSIDLNWTAQCSSNGCPKVSLAGVSADDQLIVNQTANSDGSSTLVAVTPSSNSCQTTCVSTSSIPNTTLVAFDLSGTVFSPTFETSIFSNQYFFVLPTPSAPSGTETLGGSVTAPDITIVPEPDPLPPWPQVAMNSARKALPISIKVNFTGSKTPDDNLSFLKASAPCSETLGLKDCSLDTGYWLWNLELNARVYDDASNWTVFRTDQFRVTGLYVDDNINLQPFSCSFSNPNDGPSADYLQNPTGQKSIFAIDAPGSFHDVDPDDQCLEGASPVYSETVIFNFQVNLANKITHYHHKIYYFVKIVIGGPHQLDRTNSKADYGNVSLKF